MTREELKEHCVRQIEDCEMWAKAKGEEPSGKVYEEHKLILELLEQGDIVEKIRAEIFELDIHYDNDYFSGNQDAMFKCNDVLQIIDKYMIESEE